MNPGAHLYSLLFYPSSDSHVIRKSGYHNNSKKTRTEPNEIDGQGKQEQNARWMNFDASVFVSAYAAAAAAYLCT